MTTLGIILIVLVLILGNIGGGSYHTTPYYSEYEYLARLEYRHQKRKEAQLYTIIFVLIVCFLISVSSNQETEKQIPISSEYSGSYRD